MRVYETTAIRNVAVIGHGGSGKTTLVDALSFTAGTSKRHGSVKDGTAITDYTPDEIERGYSINLALAIAEWNEVKINLIDTPGYLDFAGDAVAGIHAADAAIVVLGSTSGVEVGTEKVWGYCEERSLPRILFVSMLDKEHANFENVYQDIKAHLTPKVVPVEIPIGEGSDFRGIINLFSKRAHLYKSGTSTGEYEETDIPNEYQEQFDRYSQELIETIATTDDSLLERYLGGEDIGREEAIAALKVGMQQGEIYPLFCGAAELTYGMRALLTKVAELCPAPNERPPVTASQNGQELELSADNSGPFVAQVFKTVAEPHVGEVSFFRIYSGKTENGQDVKNATRDKGEKFGHLSVQNGKDREEVPTLFAGDIGTVAKLHDTHTGDSLTAGEPIVLSDIPFPDPVISAAVAVTKQGEEDKLSTGLHKLHEEDPTFHHEYNSELRQTIVRGLGERHIEVVVGRLERKFGVHGELVKPKIAYRETIRSKAEGQGKHKKQSGGRGQYGDCWIRLSPLPRGGGFEFDNKIVGGAIPSKFIPAVKRGIVEAAERGIRAGCKAVDFKVELYDGSYHNVDSNEMSFKLAGILAFRNVSEKAKPIILEPIMELDVWTPDDCLGDVMGDLSSRRGQILGSEPDGRLTKVRAMVPEAELYKYSTQLHSMTRGRGTFRQQYHGYQEVPSDVATKIIDERKKEKEEAA